MSGVEVSPAMAALRLALALEDVGAQGVSKDTDVRLACWMLSQTQPWPDAARATLQTLVDAHRSGTTDAAMWRGLRRDAVAMGAAADPEVKLLGSVAEAAAWPLDASIAGLVELMRAVCQLRAWRGSLRTGWTAEEEMQAISILDGIAQGDGTTVPERQEIPGLFEAAHPALARRFVAQLNASNAAFGAFRAEVAAWIAGTAR